MRNLIIEIVQKIPSLIERTVYNQINKTLIYYGGYNVDKVYDVNQLLSNPEIKLFKSSGKSSEFVIYIIITELNILLFHPNKEVMTQAKLILVHNIQDITVFRVGEDELCKYSNSKAPKNNGKVNNNCFSLGFEFLFNRVKSIALNVMSALVIDEVINLVSKIKANLEKEYDIFHEDFTYKSKSNDSSEDKYSSEFFEENKNKLYLIVEKKTKYDSNALNRTTIEKKEPFIKEFNETEEPEKKIINNNKKNKANNKDFQLERGMKFKNNLTSLDIIDSNEINVVSSSKEIQLISKDKQKAINTNNNETKLNFLDSDLLIEQKLLTNNPQINKFKCFLKLNKPRKILLSNNNENNQQIENDLANQLSKKEGILEESKPKNLKYCRSYISNNQLSNFTIDNNDRMKKTKNNYNDTFISTHPKTKSSLDIETLSFILDNKLAKFEKNLQSYQPPKELLVNKSSLPSQEKKRSSGSSNNSKGSFNQNVVSTELNFTLINQHYMVFDHGISQFYDYSLSSANSTNYKYNNNHPILNLLSQNPLIDSINKYGDLNFLSNEIIQLYQNLIQVYSDQGNPLTKDYVLLLKKFIEKLEVPKSNE